MKSTFTSIDHFRRRALRSILAALLLATAGLSVGRSAQETAAPAETELRQRIRDLVHGLEKVPLPVIIDALTGCRVLAWTGEDEARLAATAADVLGRINTVGIEAGRVNEAGNVVERHVVAALVQNGFVAGRPAGASGRARAAGYPDLEALRDGRHYYVEVKSFGASTLGSSQRTFYLSPSSDFKVTRDAVHLLIAVELIPEGANRYRARSVRWLDLSRLRCDLKHEFNASNRDLYDAAQELEILLVAAPGAIVPSDVD